jgi:Pyruvate/2-oxoacid:ferredoxin oxidoreductase gamma subunit
MFKSMFVTGLGGQGVITFARLIAGYATTQGLKVSLFNSKGMAQRGGRVTSEIRISSDNDFIYGARLSAGGSDFLIGMEVGEAVNSLHFLKTGGLALLIDYAVVPTSMILKKETYPSLHQVREVFSQKTNRFFAVAEPKHPYNVYLLGVLAALLERLPEAFPGFTCKGLQQTVELSLNRHLEENLRVYNEGCMYGGKLTGL